ncbi:MAG: ABC transporter ATP-binding protein [Bacillota bacterium]
MTNQYHEEEVIGKAYDSRLMKRLLTYARPYWKNMLLAVLMLAVITGAELARPYITKIAIDEHLLGITRPMQAFEPGSEPEEGILFEGRVFVRRQLNEEPLPDAPHCQLLQSGKRFYLVEDVALNPDTDKFEIIETEDGYRLVHDNKTYIARLMEPSEVAVFRANDNRSLIRLAAIFFGLALIAFVFNYGQVYLLQYTSQKIIHNMRRQIFTHLQGMSLSFFDKNPVGRLVTRVTNDTDTLNEMYGSVLVNLFRDIFTILGVIVIMFQLDFRLALISLSTLPLIILAAIIFRRYAREAYRNVRTALARINAAMSENIMGMRIVQIFRQEGKKHREFDAINKRYFAASMQELRVFAVFRPLMDLMFSLAMALLIWIGGRQILAGVVSFGLVMAFINYMSQFFQPIMELTEKYNILQAAMASSERIFMLLDTEPGAEDSIQSQLPETTDLPKFKGHIEFKNVWFAYNDEDWVLRDVSFEIKPGETAAFVGATGAGKTSIISLMSRLYEIQKGEILIDGVNIKDYNLAQLRRNIGVVLQDVYMFTGDIKSNIRLNNNDISDEKVKEVARYVNADKFIEQMPAQYDEPVVERGATLSAGQRQLLAFARALAFDPSILVLDEATANIDTETEVLIQDALYRLIKDRTTIVVAHRLSTIQHSDKIIVLHKGKIREMGNHQELLANKGLYYDLYRLQYKDQLIGDGEHNGEVAASSSSTANS